MGVLVGLCRVLSNAESGSGRQRGRRSLPGYSRSKGQPRQQMGMFERARVTGGIDWSIALGPQREARRAPLQPRTLVGEAGPRGGPDGDLTHFACIQGESPLHTACRCGLAGLTAELLQQGANPNLQTQRPLPEDASGVAMQSPLHMAIAHNHPDVVSVILEQKGQILPVVSVHAVQLEQNTAPHRFLRGCLAANALHATNNFQIIPDFSLKDSLDQTVLGLALWTGKALWPLQR